MDGLRLTESNSGSTRTARLPNNSMQLTAPAG